MPEAFSTPNLVALPITSQELGRGAFLPPTKIGLSNSLTTIGLKGWQCCLFMREHFLTFENSSENVNTVS